MSENNTQETRKVKLKSDELFINTPPLLPNELDYSYLARTCSRNAYGSVSRFTAALRGQFYCREIKTIRLDGLNTNYDELFEFEDGKKFSEETSLIPLLIMFMPDKNRQKVLFDHKGVRGLLDSLCLCPECAKEDVEKYGNVYFHMEHCIPGVSVCYKHGCELERQTWAINAEETIYPNLTETCTRLPLADEYAQFAAGLLPYLPFLFKVSKEDIQYIVQKKLKEEANGMDISLMPTKEEEIAYSNLGEIRMKTLMKTSRAIEFTAGMLILTKVFKEPDLFIAYAKANLTEKKIQKDITDELAKDTNFSLVSLDSRNGLRYAELKHNVCGHTFWRGVSEFHTRESRCPYCRTVNTTKEGFREKFEKQYGEKFTLLSEYNSSARAIKVGIKGTEIILKDRPGAMKTRLDWLMADEAEMNRIIETGVIRDLVNEKEKMMTFIEGNFREDEPFLSSSLPSSPDLHHIMKGLCDRGVIYRLSPAVYCRSLIDISDEEIINLKYIGNGDRRYGYDVGDRFLKEIIPSYRVQQKERHLVTNSNHMVLYHKLSVVVGETPCSVYRSDLEITEENWKVLAAISFFRHEGICSNRREDHYIPQIASWAVREGITTQEIKDNSINCAEQTRERIRELMKEMNRCQAR